MSFALKSLAAAALLAGVGLGLGAAAPNDAFEKAVASYDKALEAGDYREAEAAARQIAPLADNVVRKAGSSKRLAWAMICQDRNEEALPLLREALELKVPADSIFVGSIPNDLGVALWNLEKYDEAQKSFQQALAAFEKIKGPKSDEAATATMNLGNVQLALGHHDEAQRLYKQAMAIYEAAGKTESLGAGYVLWNMGRLDTARIKFADAQRELQRALAVREKLLSRQHPEVGKILSDLGRLHRDQKKFAPAEKADRRALAIAENSFGVNHRFVAKDLEALASDLDGLHRDADARALRTRLKRLKGEDAKAPWRWSVIVRPESATLYDGQQAVATVSRGQQYDVFALNGKWCAVEAQAAGKSLTGWLRDCDLIGADSQAVLGEGK